MPTRTPTPLAANMYSSVRTRSRSTVEGCATSIATPAGANQPMSASVGKMSVRSSRSRSAIAAKPASPVTVRRSSASSICAWTKGPGALARALRPREPIDGDRAEGRAGGGGRAAARDEQQRHERADQVGEHAQGVDGADGFDASRRSFFTISVSLSSLRNCSQIALVDIPIPVFTSSGKKSSYFCNVYGVSFLWC